MRHLNNGTDHRHSKSCCDQSSPARRTMIEVFTNGTRRQGCKRTTPLKIKIDCMTYCFNRFNHGVSRDNFCCLRNWTLYPLGLLHQKCYDPWWRHQMETFSALLALSAGISPVTGELPSQSHWDGALIFSLICAWTNGCANNRDSVDLRHHRAHYDCIVMHTIASVHNNRWNNPEEYGLIYDRN